MFWGMFDMHGSVGGWCQDWWGEYDVGGGSPVKKPTGPESGFLQGGVGETAGP